MDSSSSYGAEHKSDKSNLAGEYGAAGCIHMNERVYTGSYDGESAILLFVRSPGTGWLVDGDVASQNETFLEAIDQRKCDKMGTRLASR